MAKKAKATTVSLKEHEGHPIVQEQGTVLYVFGLNGRDVGIISVTTYKEKKALDIRRYYLDEESAEWRPTSKGIRIPADCVEEVLDFFASQRETISALIA